MHKYTVYLYFINVLINITNVPVLTGRELLELCHVTPKSAGVRSSYLWGSLIRQTDEDACVCGSLIQLRVVL